MATRFYFDPTNAPSVSPGYASVWDAPPDNRRKLVIDTRGHNGSTYFGRSETSATIWYSSPVQFVSEPLDSISATLSACKGAFRCSENEAKANAVLHVVFRICDQDGSNATDIASITDDTEFDDALFENRFFGSSDLANQVFSQGDRLIVEVGIFFNNTKDTSYSGGFYVTDNQPVGDLPENDTETSTYNSWIETGDTFTEASGEPAAIKLGPMFAFA